MKKGSLQFNSPRSAHARFFEMLRLASLTEKNKW